MQQVPTGGYPANDPEPTVAQIAAMRLSGQTEPFDSFWEGPEEDFESGFGKFKQFYEANYLPHVPEDRDGRILVVSCGPGYFVEMLVKHGYKHVLGIDSFAEKIEHARRHNLECRVAHAFPFVAEHESAFDTIVCEQELNHLTKEEMRHFLGLVHRALVPGGRLIVHGLNRPGGAGSEHRPLQYVHRVFHPPSAGRSQLRGSPGLPLAPLRVL
jgi:SAM-dependent methyltransferase